MTMDAFMSRLLHGRRLSEEAPVRGCSLSTSSTSTSATSTSTSTSTLASTLASAPPTPTPTSNLTLVVDNPGGRGVSTMRRNSLETIGGSSTRSQPRKADARWESCDSSTDTPLPGSPTSPIATTCKGTNDLPLPFSSPQPRPRQERMLQVISPHTPNTTKKIIKANHSIQASCATNGNGGGGGGDDHGVRLVQMIQQLSYKAALTICQNPPPSSMGTTGGVVKDRSAE